MLSWEADVEAHALREQGWTISAIARHLGHDRKTIRAYLGGRRVPEVRVRREPTLTEPFLEYCRLRLAEDPHLWASTLFDELTGLGFAGSYPSLTAAIRAHRLRPREGQRRDATQCGGGGVIRVCPRRVVGITQCGNPVVRDAKAQEIRPFAMRGHSAVRRAQAHQGARGHGCTPRTHEARRSSGP